VGVGEQRSALMNSLGSELDSTLGRLKHKRRYEPTIQSPCTLRSDDLPECIKHAFIVILSCDCHLGLELHARLDDVCQRLRGKEERERGQLWISKHLLGVELEARTERVET